MEKTDNGTALQFNRSYAGFVTISSLGVVHLINTCILAEQTQTVLHYLAPSISAVVGYVFYCIFAPIPTPEQAKSLVEHWWYIRSLKSELELETDEEERKQIQDEIKQFKKERRKLRRPQPLKNDEPAKSAEPKPN